MCFCLLPVTGSDLNFLLPREVFCVILDIFDSFWTFCAVKLIRFENGKWFVSSRSTGLQDSASQTDDEIPSGRRESWLRVHDRKQHLHNFKHKMKHKFYLSNKYAKS